MAEFALDGLKALDLVAAKKARQAKQVKTVSSSPDPLEFLMKAQAEKSRKRQEATAYSEKFGIGLPRDLGHDKPLDPYAMKIMPQAILAERQEHTNAEIDKEYQHLMARVGELAQTAGGSMLQQDEMGQDLVDLAMMERASGHRRRILIESVLSKAVITDTQRSSTPTGRPSLPCISLNAASDQRRASQSGGPASQSMESMLGRRMPARASENGAAVRRSLLLTPSPMRTGSQNLDLAQDSSSTIGKLPPLLGNQPSLHDTSTWHTSSAHASAPTSRANSKPLASPGRIGTTLTTERHGYRSLSPALSREPVQHSPALLKSKNVGSYIAFLGGADSSNGSIDSASTDHDDAVVRSPLHLSSSQLLAIGSSRGAASQIKGSIRGQSSPGFATSRLCEEGHSSLGVVDRAVNSSMAHKTLGQHLEKILKQ